MELDPVSAAENNINVIMWIPTVKALKIRFDAYKNKRSEVTKKNIPLGKGVSLVRDMFVADTMEEAKEKAGQHMVNYMRWVCHWRGLEIIWIQVRNYQKLKVN